jgi:hypothetical protein
MVKLGDASFPRVKKRYQSSRWLNNENTEIINSRHQFQCLWIVWSWTGVTCSNHTRAAGVCPLLSVLFVLEMDQSFIQVVLQYI